MFQFQFLRQWYFSVRSTCGLAKKEAKMYLKERVYWDTRWCAPQIGWKRRRTTKWQSHERERESSSAMLYYRIYTPQKMGYIFKHIREELLPLEAVYIFDRYGVINNRVFVLLQRSGFLSASFSFLRLLFPLCTRRSFR